MSDVLENSEEVLVSNITDEVNFVETDAEAMTSELISRFEEYLGTTLYAGDERRIFLQGIAYVLTDQLVRINETGKENLLRYAYGSELDALGEFYQNKRIGAKSAGTTIAFTMSTIPTVNITIPAGTRVTPNGKVFFATDDELRFYKGDVELTKTVTATATVSGADHNDFDVGQINKLVDSNPYVASVSNTTMSSGGSDVESDAEYRERLRISPFAFSVAGPAKAYEAIAMSASAEVGGVAVYSPSAGVVEIAVVKNGGEIPDASDRILSDVRNACSDKDCRPLTDKVQVVPASGVNIDIDVTYYIAGNDTSKKDAIENAAEEYAAWQSEKIGRDIIPDKLTELMREAGAARVAVTSPTYRAMATNEIAKIGTVKVTYGGSVNV